MKKILFVPDVHIPFEDKKAWSLMLRAARHWEPDILAVLGDFQDFYAVSDHDKNPDRPQNLEWEIHCVNQRLNELVALGAKDKRFVAGNHEHRLTRYLTKHAPAMFDMLDVPSLLHLKKRGWKYTPYGKSDKIGRLYITHDEGNAGPYANIRARATFEGNVVIGHTHRMAVSYQGNAAGKAHVGAMFGWLGDLSAIDYMARVRSQQWQHGFGIGRLLPSGDVHLQAVPIVNGQCVVEGKVIR